MKTIKLYHPDLGMPVAEFRPYWRTLWLIEGFFLAIAAFGLWGVVAHGVGALPLLLFGLVPAVAALFAALHHNLGRRIVLYEYGLADTHDRNTTSFCWDDVLWLRFHGRTRASAKLVVGLRDGRTVKLTTFLDGDLRRPGDGSIALPRVTLADILARVEQAVAPRICEQAVADYARGSSVDFGAFQISVEGIRVGRHHLAWYEVEDIDVLGERLILTRTSHRGAWRSFHQHQVHNAFAFLPVLEAVWGERFSLLRAPGTSKAAATVPIGRKIINEILALSMYVLVPFVVIFGMFAWDYHDWSTNPRRHIESAYTCLHMGNPTSALESFDRALAIDPENASARCGRATALQMLGRTAEARTDLRFCRAGSAVP